MNGKILDGAFLDSLDTLDLYVHQMTSGHYSGSRRSRAYGSSPEFADYRDYIPGDDLRRIDWNLAGRFEKYYIKRFIDEKQGRNCIYLDQSASMGMDGKALMALRLCAALSYLSVAHMDSVSVRLLHGADCRDLCTRIVGREGFYAAAARMEEIVFSGETDLCAAMRSDPAPGFDDGVTYLISDFLTDSDWRAAVDDLLARRREVALIQVLSPAELRPELNGTYCFADAERPGARVNMEIDRDALAAYQLALGQFVGDIRRFCASRGVPFISVGSDERVEDVLLTKGCVEELIR